jgi:hypothetical protein
MYISKPDKFKHHTSLLLLPFFCRVKHKQELGGLRQELQKLQTDAKMGNKSKEMASKDLETTKKKLQDTEAKLKAALTDKQTALQARELVVAVLRIWTYVDCMSDCVISMLTLKAPQQ